jgi:aconitate hydratase
MLVPDPEVEADPAKYYDRVVELDLAKLGPYMVGPHSPDRARPISKLAAEVADPKNGFIDHISTALIGSCTNSSYEDMSRAADIAEQAKARGLKAAVPFLVTPGSEQVRATSNATARCSRSRTWAARCSPMPAARASASGAGQRKRARSRTRS